MVIECSRYAKALLSILSQTHHGHPPLARSQYPLFDRWKSCPSEKLEGVKGKA